MQHLSRRFSGYVFLYVAIASIAAQVIPSLLMIGVLPVADGTYSALLWIFRFIVYLPPLIFIAARKYPFARVLRLNAFPAKYVWYAIGLGICMALFLQILSALPNSLFNTVINQSESVIFFNWPHTIWPNILTAFFIHSLLGVTLYQGAIYSGLHAVKPLKACLLIGLLYGLVAAGSSAATGATVLTLVFSAFIGFALSYVALQSGSILPAIIASFVYYLLNIANLADLLYQYILSPMYISQVVAAIGLLIIAGSMGSMLLLIMPRVKTEGRPLRMPSFKGFRQRLTQPYIPAPNDETPGALEQTPEPAVPEAVEALADAANDPGDTAKNRNVGFIIGSALLGALTLASLIYTIIMVISYSSDLYY